MACLFSTRCRHTVLPQQAAIELLYRLAIFAIYRKEISRVPRMGAPVLSIWFDA